MIELIALNACSCAAYAVHRRRELERLFVDVASSSRIVGATAARRRSDHDVMLFQGSLFSLRLGERLPIRGLETRVRTVVRTGYRHIPAASSRAN
jgi:hypothetical protein